MVVLLHQYFCLVKHSGTLCGEKWYCFDGEDWFGLYTDYKRIQFVFALNHFENNRIAKFYFCYVTRSVFF